MKILCAGLLMAAFASACGAPAHVPATVLLDAKVVRNDIERIASEEIERAALEWGATRAVVVVLDPRTGETLASVGRELGQSVPSLASEHAWITGSTLKTFTVASALEEHTVTLDQRFPCGERAYGTEILHDAAEGPCAPLDVAGILAKSSNVGTSYVFDTLGSARLRRHLGALHIGDSPGTLPTLDDDRGIRAANLAGGEVATATPTQLARAYATLLNDGVYVGHADPGKEAPEIRVFSEATARAVVPMLENAVAVGTGKGAAIAGARVAGKTGTAEWTDAAGKETYYASFVGTVLDREPRFVALVGLEVPGGRANGPKAAAPAWGRIAARIVSAK